MSLPSHLHGEVTAGCVCLETLLLLEREAVEEGRGESLAAWVCAFLLGEAGAGSGNKSPGALRHGLAALGQVILHGKGLGGAGGL